MPVKIIFEVDYKSIFSNVDLRIMSFEIGNLIFMLTIL